MFFLPGRPVVHCCARRASTWPTPPRQWCGSRCEGSRVHPRAGHGRDCRSGRRRALRRWRPGPRRRVCCSSPAPSLLRGNQATRSNTAAGASECLRAGTDDPVSLQRRSLPVLSRRCTVGGLRSTAQIRRQASPSSPARCSTWDRDGRMSRWSPPGRAVVRFRWRALRRTASHVVELRGPEATRRSSRRGPTGRPDGGSAKWAGTSETRCQRPQCRPSGSRPATGTAG